MKHANRVEIPVNKALNVSVIQRLFVACCCAFGTLRDSRVGHCSWAASITKGRRDVRRDLTSRSAAWFSRRLLPYTVGPTTQGEKTTNLYTMINCFLQFSYNLLMGKVYCNS